MVTGRGSLKECTNAFANGWKEGTAKHELQSKQINNVVNKRGLRLGMTKQEVRRVWGSPYRINRSVGSWGVHEQWSYTFSYRAGSRLLYFENGILTSWQV